MAERNSTLDRALQAFHRAMASGQQCIDLDRLQRLLTEYEVPSTGGKLPTHRSIGRGGYALPRTEDELLQAAREAREQGHPVAASGILERVQQMRDAELGSE